MTLDAKILGPICFKVEQEVSAMGIMTAHTCYFLTVSRIINPFADRMGELALGCMTIITDLIPIAFQHRQII